VFEGAVYGNLGTCCNDFVDACGGCHEGNCTGDPGCEGIGNKVGCEDENAYTVCTWSVSEYTNPKNDDPSWNLSGYASLDGVEDDGSIYCDCYGNVEDCYTVCGGLESTLAGVIGVYECIGDGSIDNQIECENKGKCSGHALFSHSI
jgi:hypothetical protein